VSGQTPVVTARTRRRAIAAVVAAAGINLILTSVVHFHTLRAFPDSGDEDAYLLGAQLLASGRLSVPSPEPHAAFELNQFVNDGRFFPKYPPGWPALLAVGVRAHAPWLVNAVLGVVALVLTWRLARRLFGDAVAALAASLLSASPYVVFNSASSFSQPASLVWTLVFLGAFYDVYGDRQRRGSWLVMGVAAGLLLVTRPFTAALVVVPLLTMLVPSMRRRPARDRMGAAVSFGAGVLPFVGALLAYNHALTGAALVQPFTLYDPRDRPFLTQPPRGLWWTLKHNVVERLWLLNLWMPLSVVAAAAFIVTGPRRATPGATTFRHARPLLILFIALLGGYACYFTSAGNEYGPRYVYEALGALAIVMALVMVDLPSATRAVLVATVVAGNVVWLGVQARAHAAQVDARMQPFTLAREQGLRDAIVFIAPGGSGDMVARDLTRNGLSFDGAVIFVLDRGPENNAAVLARYPGRAAYRYDYDRALRRGRLAPQ
jgi:4-amino-4-deoxy-L-arabinose transferase-like glycosyltransferase